MPTYLEPIGVPQWAEGEKPKREQFNKVFEDLNNAYAGISTDAVQRAETAAASAKQNAQGAAASAEQARQIAANTEVQYQVREDQVGFKRPADKDYTWTGPLTGPQGPTGKPLHVAGHFDTLDALNAAHPAGDGENAYLVGGKVCVFADGAWREIGVDVTASDVPTAAGQTVQQELDGLHTDVWDAFNVLSDTPKSYAAGRPCIIRPSFAGRTVQEGKPSPDSPVPIKGVLNPWARAYTGDPVQITADAEPMMALPDRTQDRIALRDGVWGIERYYKSIILTEDTSNVYAQADRLDITPLPSPPKNNGDAVSTHSSAFGMWNVVGGGQGMCSFDLVFPTQDAWKSYAKSQREAGTPITIWYRLDTPTFDPIPAWKGYGKIDPITVTTTITKPNPDAPISPDNVATITGTPVVTTGYRGLVRQLAGELFERGEFDGANLAAKMRRTTFDGTEAWGLGANPAGTLEFALAFPDSARNGPSYLSNSTCNRFVQISGDDMYNNNLAGAVYCLYQNAPPSPGIIFALPGITTLDTWKSKLAEWAAAGQPLEVVYELAAPAITRHNLDLTLTSGNWIIEAGDDNGLLESMSVEVLPDPATYGNRIYPYQHAKAGNVHQLTGTPGAAEISFAATAPYLDGDTWTINGAPVAATYADGQALLPTAVIAGESVRAVLEREAVMHIDGIIMPGENLLVNSDFNHPVNSQGQKEYTSAGYTIDDWKIFANMQLTVNDGFIRIKKTATAGNPGFMQALKTKDLVGEVVTATIMYRGNFAGGGMRLIVGMAVLWLQPANDWTVCTLTARAELSSFGDLIDSLIFGLQLRSFLSLDDYIDVKRIRVEPGPRFTGWGESLFDALRLMVDKPTPQKNLLDNGDLRNPVNQRGQQKYTNAGYTVDRWMITTAQPNVLSVEPTSAGLKLTSTEYGCRLRQILELPETYSGKTVTFTAILATDCTGIFNMWIFGQSPTDNGGATYAYKAIENAKANTPISITATLPNDNRYLAVQIRVESGTAILQLAKLEPGPRFTGWCDPKPGETLAECQRYFLPIKRNRLVGHQLNDAIYCFLPTPVTMRTTPVIKSGTVYKYHSNGFVSIENPVFIEVSVQTNGISLMLKDGTNMTAMIELQVDDMTLSADL